MNALGPLLILAAAGIALWTMPRRSGSARPSTSTGEVPGPGDNLSAHYSYEDLTGTSTGLANVPDATTIANLMWTAALLERIRGTLNDELMVTSGYRSEAVNDAINGADGSYHLTGRAADFKAAHYSAEQVATVLHPLIKTLGIGELIWYDAGRGGHVHVATAGKGRCYHAPDSGGYNSWAP